MSRKYLIKNYRCFLEQPFAENILSCLKPEKKQKRFKWERKSSKVNYSPVPPHTTTELGLKISTTRERFKQEGSKDITLISSRSSRMIQAEKQIIDRFWTSRKEETLSTGSVPQESFLKENKECLDTDARKRSLSVRISHKDRLRYSKIFPTMYKQPNVQPLLSIEQIRDSLTSRRFSRGKHSEYKNQLLECKKIRLLYGNLSHRHLQKSVKKARRLSGPPGDNLLIVLESRLDVALERCAFSCSVKSARQSILHGRVCVNSRTVKNSSYQLKPGDVIKINSSLLDHEKKKSPLCNTSVFFEKKEEVPLTLAQYNISRSNPGSNPPIGWGLSFSATAFFSQIRLLFLHIKSEIRKKTAKTNIKQGNILKKLPQDFSFTYLKKNLPTRVDIETLERCLSNNVLVSRIEKKSRFYQLFVKQYFENDWRKTKQSLCMESQPTQSSFGGPSGNTQIKDKMSIGPQKQKQLERGVDNSVRTLRIEAQVGKRKLFLSRERWLAQFVELSGSLNITPFYNTCLYWLYVKKRLLGKMEQEGYKSKEVLPLFGEKVVYCQKRLSKPLHMELSYKSHTAIFLYPPQRVLLPAIVDLDLLVKAI